MNIWTLKFKNSKLEKKFLQNVCSNIYKQFCLSRVLRLVIMFIAFVMMIIVKFEIKNI